MGKSIIETARPSSRAYYPKIDIDSSKTVRPPCGLMICGISKYGSG